MTTATLEPLAPSVLSARTRFLESLEGLPTDFRSVIETAYAGRTGDEMPIGEMAVFLLVDLLPGATQTGANRVAPSLFGLRAHNVSLDDGFDNPNGLADTYEYTLAANLLFQRSLTALLEQLPQTAEVRVQIDRHFAEQALAARSELIRCRQLQEYSDQDVARMGEKCSLCKIYGIAILAASGAPSLDEELLVPVQDLATFIQFLDDITDWKEDWHVHNFTYLLTETVLGMTEMLGAGRLQLDGRSTQEIFAAMVATGALEKTIVCGSQFLDRVLASSQLQPGSCLDLFLRDLLAAKDQLVLAVADARRQCELLSREDDWFERLTLNRDTRSALALVQEKLAITAQSC